MWLGSVVAATLLGLGLGSSEKHDSAYWAQRMEQALLPLGSLRATLVLQTRERLEPPLDPETALPQSVEFFDTRGILRRTVSYAEIDREGPYRFPLRVEAVETSPGRRSSVRFEEVELGAEVYEYEFGEPHLRRVLRELQGRPV